MHLTWCFRNKYFYLFHHRVSTLLNFDLINSLQYFSDQEYTDTQFKTKYEYVKKQRC